MKLLKGILALLLCATLVLTGVAVYTQNYSGRYSSVNIITDEERQWILERFGCEYDSIEEYLSTMQTYARQHFKYDYDKSNILQHYDFASIRHGDEIHGLCFDFAVLFKNVTLVLDEAGYLPSKDIRVYVVDVTYPNTDRKNHSFNVVSLPTGDNYWLCLTTSASRAEKGLEPLADYDVFQGSITDYCKQYNETVYGLH